MPKICGLQAFSVHVLFLFQGFGLVDIDTGHEPVKLSPGQISDLRVFPRPLVSAMHCQLL